MDDETFSKVVMSGVLAMRLHPRQYPDTKHITTNIIAAECELAFDVALEAAATFRRNVQWASEQRSAAQCQQQPHSTQTPQTQTSTNETFNFKK